MIDPNQLVRLLANVPESWYGTTFPNDGRYVGRQRFMAEMHLLLSGNKPIEAAHLAAWFPEDYVRLGSPLSTILELMQAVEKGLQPSHVFGFGSSTLPLIAVLLTSRTTHVYGCRLFSIAQESLLRECYGCNFTFNSGEPQIHSEDVVVQIIQKDSKFSPLADAIVSPSEGLLYVINPSKIAPEDVICPNTGIVITEGIHTIRKRFGGPIPTPDVDAKLRKQSVIQALDTTELKQHLKQLAGCSDCKGDVLIATTGLAALGACVMGALDLGGRDINIVQCSTAYGGSSQQADILSKKCANLTKHTFDIQGIDGDVFRSLTGRLQAMRSSPKKSLTLVQLEYPTNPDMRDCDLKALEPHLEAFREATGSEVVLMFDTTFSPIARPAEGLFATIPVIVFNSLSKSVSGGLTTGGSLVANAHPVAQSLLERAHAHLELLDTGAKPCQLAILAQNHFDTECRIQLAHQNAIAAATFLENCVHRFSGATMRVNFVSQTQIAKGVTPATFSFNLPAPVALQHDTKRLEAVAQTFVDRLVEQYPQGIKPCVSFGQKVSYVYVTVPATSTQGVISKEAKAKQAIGGVQLVRFSFPPQFDLEGWNNAIEATIERLYALQPSL